MPKPETTIVLYTAAYCPYCQDFKPTWEKFTKDAKKLIKDQGKDMKIETVEITKGNGRELAMEDGVDGFPTVLKKYNKLGRKYKFNKDRTVENLIQFSNL